MALEKLKIHAFRNGNFTEEVGQPLSVSINPEEYSHTYSIDYTCASGQGANVKSPQFNKMGSERVAFTLWFDGTGVVPGGAARQTTSIDSELTTFRNTVISYEGDIHQPKFLRLVWGTLLFNCCIEKLDVTYTLFAPDGNPIRAKCGVSFRGYASAKAAAAEANNQSPDMSHAVTVRAGDTLPLLCHRVYGSSVHYTKVARFNGLGSFRDLRPGMQLLFPRLEQHGR